MDKDPLLARDWIKMTMKFPGFCLICKKRIKSAEVGYWSKSIKSILHEDCYDNSDLHARNNQNSLVNKKGQNQKNGDNLLADFITQGKNKIKCFICGSKIDFQDSLILTLLKLEKNVNNIETIFCSTCLTCSDPHILKEYKFAFSKNLKSF
jgi:hypothetical protein